MVPYCVSATMIFNCSSHPRLPISTSYPVATPVCWYRSRLRITEESVFIPYQQPPHHFLELLATCLPARAILSAWVYYLPLTLLCLSNALISLRFSCSHLKHCEFKIQLRHLFSAAFTDPLRGGIPSLCFYSTLKNFFYNIYSILMIYHRVFFFP